jgi:flagellin
MSLSIQTNVASLSAENNIRLNSQFQNQTINRLSSGYRINSSADDAAGLAVANQLQGTVTELTQGVQNANNSVSQLQVIDGGLNNITQILNRLQTLATESASSTFTGDRNTLNAEYQSDLAEINRQAANIGLNTGGKYNSQLQVYTGGGNNQSNSQLQINLSGTNNAVDTTALGLASTSVTGGGTEIAGTARLDNTANTFLAGSSSQTLTGYVNTGSGAVAFTAQVDGGANGLSGQGVVDSLNKQLQQYGISATIATDGNLQLSGATAFTVEANAVTGGSGTAFGTAATPVVNTANYNASSATFAAFTGSDTESFTIQNGTKSVNINLTATNAPDIATAVQNINSSLSGSGVFAVQSADGSKISFQSTSAFSINETAAPSGAGTVFGSAGAQTVNGPTASASSTGNALSALSALQNAFSNLGLVQGVVGAGENKLNFAVNLSQSQITNYSAEESGIRDADVAAEAANLTKAQVLQQASIAALAQANSAPQAVLSLLKG